MKRTCSLPYSLHSLPQVAFLWYASGAAAHIPVIFLTKAALPRVMSAGWPKIMRMNSTHYAAFGLLEEDKKFLRQLQFTWAEDGSCFPPRGADRVKLPERCDNEWRWVILLHLSVCSRTIVCFLFTITASITNLFTLSNVVCVAYFLPCWGKSTIGNRLSASSCTHQNGTQQDQRARTHLTINSINNLYKKVRVKTWKITVYCP